ncbi:MAG: hypothetical protein C0490_08160 [Marivirga sp.]|nr:hypothetical protein [Marivirga sp.]
MNPDYFFGDVKFNDIILWILAFSGIVSVADSVGLLPPSWARWLARNRVDSILAAMKKLGVRLVADNYDRRTVTRKIFETLNISTPEYKRRLSHMLTEDTFQSAVQIGGTRLFHSNEFIDVIGASTSHTRVVEYAKILNSGFNAESFDVIATPKLGSPILGYEFARLNNKPFVLGVHEKVKDTDGNLGLHNFLDFPTTLNLQGKRCLIVDDSTTGGRKMIELINKLREAGCLVEHALVLFEPKGKDARGKLAAVEVDLYSLMEGPSGRL